MQLSGLRKSVFCAIAAAGLIAGIGCGSSSGNSNESSNTGGTGAIAEGQRLYFAAEQSYPPRSTIRSVPASVSGSVHVKTHFDTQAINEQLSQLTFDKAGNFYASAMEFPATLTTPAAYEIVEYAASATGSPQPIRRIPSSVTGLNYPAPIAVDSAGNIAFMSGDLVANPQIPTAIKVFSPGKNDGPSQVISGPATEFVKLSDVSFDAAGNLYIAALRDASSGTDDYMELLEFAAGASGNVAPIRKLNLGKDDRTPQFDGAGNMYFYSTIANSSSAMIKVYAPNASGTDAPIRTITLTGTNADETGYDFRNVPIQVSPEGDIYLAAYYGGSTVAWVLIHYPPGITGVAGPPMKIDAVDFNTDYSFNGDVALH